MSLILDALRKMEQERKARRLTGTDIRPEVLSYRGIPRKPSTSSRLIPVTTVTMMLLLGIGGWFLLKEEKPVPANFPKNSSTPKIASSDPIQSPPPAPQLHATVDPPTQPLPTPAAPQKTTTPPTPQEQKPPPITEISNAPGITISGIAYQDERSLRRAVINGALLGEGAEVAGLKVVEIRENRIRFSKAGETFDLVYSTGISNR